MVPSRLGLAFVFSVALAAGAVSCTRNDSATIPPLGHTQSEGVARRTHRHAALSGVFTHVIVIQQENRTIDNMFNGFRGADYATTGNNNGKIVNLVPVPLEPAGFKGLDHSHAGFITDCDAASSTTPCRMDKFDHAISPPNTAYAYVRQSDVQNYWTLATRFTLADEVFQMNQGPSFTSHVNLVAAEGGYPEAFLDNETNNGSGPGCLGTNVIDYIDMQSGVITKKRPACLEMAAIFDLLDTNHIGWRYYAPNYGPGLQLWSAPDYIKHLAQGPDQGNLVSPETRIINDINLNALQPVSYVSPQMCSSDHPHGAYSDPLAGPHWVAAITNAVGANPTYWQNTLILVTWDDWGGWYDHKVPKMQNPNNLGFRVPLLIISAYPKQPGFPDHTTRNQASVITAIESVFGTGYLPVNPPPPQFLLDRQTDDLSSDINVGGQPVPYGSPLPSMIPPSHCNGSSAEVDPGD